MPLDLESLDIALRVLRAAVRYQMDHTIQDISRHLFDSSCHKRCLKRLMVADPLWVYAVAKELKLEQLAKRAGALTFTKDVHHASPSSLKALDTEIHMELLKMRHTRKRWLKAKLGEPTVFPIFPVEYQDHQPANGQTPGDATVPLGFYPCSCPENQFDEDGHRKLPSLLKARILDYPSPFVIEDIDFCKELQCLRCGAAANIFLGAICDSYRETFQD